MRHYFITVPDDNRCYEIYTPVYGGIRRAVTCEDCRKSVWGPDESDDYPVMLYCKMFEVAVEPTRFCSWGEPEGRCWD